MIVVRAERTEDIEAIHMVNRLAFDQEDEAALVHRIRPGEEKGIEHSWCVNWHPMPWRESKGW